MSEVSFHWERKNITPPLLMAVGSITLDWAMIDHDVTRMIQSFWYEKHPRKTIPRPFDKRSRFLRDFADTVYADEPDEWIVFRWYLQRLKDANGKRDALAHGMPGMVIKGKRKYRGLMVPHPAKSATYVPMTIREVVGLAATILNLHAETSAVSTALSMAQAASSPNKHFSQVDGKWTQLTKENRSPILPRMVPLPPTFRG